MPGGLIKLRFRLNEEEVTVSCPAGARLVDVLRDRFGLAATREGCGVGECGSCLVLKDGVVVNACLVPVFTIADAEIVTAEGIDALKSFADVRRILPDPGLLRCGFCGSGFAVALAALQRTNPEAGEQEIREALSGTLCSCGSYPGLVEEVVAKMRRKRYGRRRD
jgi:carbon-monoxide dehydrogenase small subunit